MLVLSRFKDESIIVTHNGAEMKITIVDVRMGNKVRIGFEADESFKIMREELGRPRKHTAGS